MREPGRLQSTVDIAAACADVIERVRAHSPRVHCITNAVAQNFTANTLLALGARPSMTISPEEIGSFVAGADALLVNLGTFDAARRGPRALRLNRAEFSALASSEPDGEALRRYARDALTVIGLTGETDVVTDGTRVAAIRNGHPLMSRVTAMGCVASALVAACLAVEGDPWLATTAALLAFGVAGEGAAAHAHGPGSFASEILDALDRLDRDGLLARAKVA